MSATEEAGLIDAAIAGSVAAFERLYRLHSGRVYGLCLRLADSQADAQDATQETFIKAWHSLRDFRGGSALSTWLHRIAFNEVMALKRRRSSERKHLQLVIVEESHEAPGDDLSRLERAITGLPERAREALVLNKIYGYTHEETADFMNVAVGTCKAQVHRALQLLKQACPAIGGEPMASEHDRHGNGNA